MEAQSNDVLPEEANEISAPLVFSCSKCRIIVGDTFSFMKSNAEMNTMTLTAASNIQRSADVYTSKAGPDVGSTYFRFTCAECQNGLGRYYLTTSADLDSLREKFTFTVESITSYELGKSQHGKIQDVILDLPPISTVEVGPASTGEHNPDLTLVSLNEEMLKTQAVIIDLLDRLARQEYSMHQLLTSQQANSPHQNNQHQNNHNGNQSGNQESYRKSAEPYRNNSTHNSDARNNHPNNDRNDRSNHSSGDTNRNNNSNPGPNSSNNNNNNFNRNKSPNPNADTNHRQIYSAIEPSRSVHRSLAERSGDRSLAERSPPPAMRGNPIANDNILPESSKRVKK